VLPTTTVASSCTSASPIPKLRSSSNSKVKNVGPGAAANTATLSSTLHPLPLVACRVLVSRLAQIPMLATSHQLWPATHSLLPRLPPLRKCIHFCTGKNEADLRLASEITGVNKAAATRGSAWPNRGSLQSIGTAAAFRSQNPAIPARTSAIDAIPLRTFITAPIKPDIAEMTKRSKTPSPQKVTVKIEAAGGKESFPVHVTPRST
jgi:hypothetical protein